MAISEGSSSVTKTKERRTWRIDIDTPKGRPATVRAHRELLTTDSEGEVTAKPANTVCRTIAPDVLAETVSITGGKLLTVAEIYEGISKLVDAWDVVDRAPPAEPQP